MRNLYELDHWRRTTTDVIDFFGSTGDDTCGVFDVPISTHSSGLLKVIATTAGGWDHVSVSLPNRCPTWFEKDKVKRAFFLDTETAVQFHVPTKDHINVHPYCLHLWRPQNSRIPLPSILMV